MVEFQLFIKQICYRSTCGLHCTVNFRVTAFFLFWGGTMSSASCTWYPYPTGLPGLFHIPLWYEDSQRKLVTLWPKCRCSQTWLTHKILAIQIQNPHKRIVVHRSALRLPIQAAFAPTFLGNTLLGVHGRSQRTCDSEHALGDLRKMLMLKFKTSEAFWKKQATKLTKCQQEERGQWWQNSTLRHTLKTHTPMSYVLQTKGVQWDRRDS